MQRSLIILQQRLIPKIAKEKLELTTYFSSNFLIIPYRFVRKFNFSTTIIRLIMPKKYQDEIRKLNHLSCNLTKFKPIN